MMLCMCGTTEVFLDFLDHQEGYQWGSHLCACIVFRSSFWTFSIIGEVVVDWTWLRMRSPSKFSMFLKWTWLRMRSLPKVFLDFLKHRKGYSQIQLQSRRDYSDLTDATGHFATP